MIDFSKSVETLANSYVAVHASDAISTIKEDINRAIGLRQWDKTHILFLIQKRVEKILNERIESDLSGAGSFASRTATGPVEPATALPNSLQQSDNRAEWLDG
jgi:hypothetical protein